MSLALVFAPVDASAALLKNELMVLFDNLHVHIGQLILLHFTLRYEWLTLRALHTESQLDLYFTEQSA